MRDGGPSRVISLGYNHAVLLFHLTYETRVMGRETTPPNSRPQVYTHLVHPCDLPLDTYLAGSRTYPSMSPTGDTRCRKNMIVHSQETPIKTSRHTVTGPAVM